MTLAAKPKVVLHRYKTVTDQSGGEHLVCTRCDCWDKKAPASCITADEAKVAAKATKKAASKPAPK